MWPTMEMKALLALVGSFLVSVSSTGLQSQASRMTVLSVLPWRCITASAEKNSRSSSSNALVGDAGIDDFHFALAQRGDLVADVVDDALRPNSCRF